MGANDDDDKNWQQQQQQQKQQQYCKNSKISIRTISGVAEGKLEEAAACIVGNNKTDTQILHCGQKIAFERKLE